MIGFNHASAGAIIGRYLPLPIAIPVALASHFFMDSLPHYGIDHKRRDVSKFWKTFYVIDFILAWSLAGFACYKHHYAMFLCGLIACSPDFIWVLRVVRTKSFNLGDNRSKFTQWHARIQHYERPWGIYLELPLAVVLGFCFFGAAGYFTFH